MKKALIAIFAAALFLFGLSFALQGVARENAQKEHIWLMETLLPGGSDFQKVSYDGEDTAIRSVHRCEAGYVIETATQGYADEIILYVGLTKEGTVTGLVAYSAHETPGLGSRILTDHEFLSQFLNESGSFTVGTADAFSGATAQTQSAGEEITVDGISGATVSSKAVARCVNSAVAYVTGADAVSSATSWGG